MARIAAIFRVVLGAVWLVMLVAGCGPGGGGGAGGSGSNETVSAKDIKGAAKAKADNGTGEQSKETPAKDVPADAEVTNVDPAKARGRASGAYNVTASAHAEKKAGAPPAAKASATSMATSTSAFTLTQDGKKITLTVEDHFTATLKGDDATAMIHIEARIKQGNSNVTNLDVTYKLNPNKGAADKIDVTGAHTETIKDATGYTEKAANQVTLNKGNYTMELTVTVTTSGSVMAEANVDTVTMSLPVK